MKTSGRTSKLREAPHHGEIAGRTVLWIMVLLLPGAFSRAAPTIVVGEAASPQERLAAAELRRFIYLRTGELSTIEREVGKGDSIVIGVDGSLADQAYVLRTRKTGGRLDVTGGSPVGALYGAYRLVEHLGVRFYLHGDVVPDRKIAWQMPKLDEVGKPLFELRGVNPWGSHPFGFDQWGADDYKALMSQLAKMRMNFIGMHCYLTSPYDEPTVWVGLREDIDQEGRVTFSYPARYYNTLWRGHWGPIPPKKTSAYPFGASRLFEDDTWGPDTMKGLCPTPSTPRDCVELSNRVGLQFKDAFRFARLVGVKTCIGTEAPLKKFMPAAVKARLESQGRDPADPASVLAVYEGIFERIKRTHPLDYYWIWTPERWTWHGNSDGDLTATIDDIRIAAQALENVQAPFKLATSGWVLGPKNNRAAFDAVLSKDIPMSAISRTLGHTPVDPAFERIDGRDKWAIPWLESDGKHGLAGLQLFAGRTLYDGAVAHRYGCTGLMGLHWRTRVLGPNALALARAGWQSPALGSPAADGRRRLAVEAFYRDLALASFGPEVAEDTADIFARLDGDMPVSVGGGCPSGSLSVLGGVWSDLERAYAFVGEMEAIRPRVRGAGNLERFDYWLNTFRYHRLLARVRHTFGRFEAVMKKVEARPTPDARQAMAVAEALPIYRELIGEYGGLVHLRLQTVTTHGGIATVVNLMQHGRFWPMVIDRSARRLVKVLGRALPADVAPASRYDGPGRILVPTARSSLLAGESLRLKVIVLNRNPTGRVTLAWRPLGASAYARVAMRHVARGTYAAVLEAEAIGGKDFEYHVVARAGDTKVLYYPVTAPQMNHTVVIVGAP